MLSKIQSLGCRGVSGYAVSVECHVSNGLPGFDIVGLPDAAVKEARERVRTVTREHDARDLIDRLFRHIDQSLWLGRVVVLHIHMVEAQRALRAVVVDRDVEHIGKLGLHIATSCNLSAPIIPQCVRNHRVNFCTFSRKLSKNYCGIRHIVV